MSRQIARRILGAACAVAFVVVVMAVVAQVQGCAAPRCHVPVHVTLARHPDGKPKPAALVLAQCPTPAQAWEWACDDAKADQTGVWCDGKRKIEVAP